MKINLNKLKLSDSSMFKAITKDGVKTSINFITDPQCQLPKETFGELIDKLKEFKFSMIKDIVAAYENDKITLCVDKDKSNSIIYLPAINKSTGSVEKVFVNIARFTKESTGIDMSTGSTIKKVALIGGHEMLYALLFSAFTYLNIHKIMQSSTVETYVRETYVDIFAEILSRHVSNPVDGEKLRFILSYFFYGGTKTALELAQVLHFNEDIAGNLQRTYDMSKRDNVEIDWLIDTLITEYPMYKAKGLSIETLIQSSLRGLGSTGIFVLDNTGYLVAAMCARVLSPLMFNGYMFARVEKKGGKGFVHDVTLSSYNVL